jgi:hypothetical protein
MMSEYPKDLAVKTGTYTDKSGATKGRYENIGKLMQGKDGLYVLLKKTFNPAGVETEPGRDMIVVSVFEKRDDAPQGSQPQPRQAGGATGPRGGDVNEDIPFAPRERGWIA